MHLIYTMRRENLLELLFRKFPKTVILAKNGYFFAQIMPIFRGKNWAQFQCTLTGLHVFLTRLHFIYKKLFFQKSMMECFPFFSKNHDVFFLKIHTHTHTQIHTHTHTKWIFYTMFFFNQITLFSMSINVKKECVGKKSYKKIVIWLKIGEKMSIFRQNHSFWDIAKKQLQQIF